MAHFTEIDWRRLDAFALIVGRGIASIHGESWDSTCSWLSTNGYITSSLDFTDGISPVVEQLGRDLHWVQKFGYALDGESRNLAALHDGFDFEVSGSGGLVLLLRSFRKALELDAPWSLGFLSIVSEHSLRHLACGRRFFCLLEVEGEDSPEIGQVFESLSVPYPFPLSVNTAA